MDFTQRSARLALGGLVLGAAVVGGAMALSSGGGSVPAPKVHVAEVVAADPSSTVAPSTVVTTVPATVAPVTDAPAADPEPGLEVSPPPMPAPGQPVVPVDGPYGDLYPDGYVDPNLAVPQPPTEVPVTTTTVPPG